MRKNRGLYFHAFIFIGLLPLLLLCIQSWRNPNFDLVSFMSTFGHVSDLGFFAQWKGILLDKLFDGSTSIWVNFVLDFNNYILVCSLVELAFGCVLFFIRLIKGLANRLGGDLL